MKDKKDWTGERLETYIYNENTFEHLHRYAIASTLVKDKDVLDIASGEGYGSNLLAMHAANVIGVDIDREVVEQSSKKYVSANLQFRVGRADLFPVEDNSIDVVVSFETLEHHNKHEEMFIEIKRVLRLGGILIISTPDKKFYSDDKEYKNPFHVKELYFDEFKSLVNEYFVNSNFYYQNIFKGTLVIPEHGKGMLTFFEGDYNRLSNASGIKPMYLIGIASDSNLMIPDSSVFTSEEIEKMENQLIIEEKELLKEQIRRETIEWISNSWSYKIGSLLLSPLKMLRR